MSDQLSMFGEMNSEDSPNATSLPGLADGPMPLSSQDGEIGPSGQGVAHVSRSVRPEKDGSNRMSVPCGLIGEGSLSSQKLQSSLENRLMMRLPLDGLMKSEAPWRRKRTPSLRRYCQFILSGEKLIDLGFFLWPTPNCSGWRGFGHTTAKRKLETPFRPSGARIGSDLMYDHRLIAEYDATKKTKFSPVWLAFLMGYPPLHSRELPGGTGTLFILK